MDHIEKLGKLIQQLRLQEQGYVDLLQRTLVSDFISKHTTISTLFNTYQIKIITHIYIYIPFIY